LKDALLRERNVNVKTRAIEMDDSDSIENDFNNSDNARIVKVISFRAGHWTLSPFGVPAAELPCDGPVHLCPPCALRHAFYGQRFVDCPSRVGGERTGTELSTAPRWPKKNDQGTAESITGHLVIAEDYHLNGEFQ
jgi:hypothetical protein